MDIIDFVMHKEKTEQHNALLKWTEIIHYLEGKINNQKKQNKKNPTEELNMSRKQR